MTYSTLRFGLIGCGTIAREVHLPLLSRISGVDVGALADIDDGQLKQAAIFFPSAEKLNDYGDLLAMENIDCVIISVPSALHAEIAGAAISAGKHIYLEKPLASNMNDAREVLHAWRRADVVGMIGFNFRFNPLYRRMRDMIQRGHTGPLIGARTVFTTVAQSRPDWTSAEEEGGGVLLELASHDIDLTRFLFDAEILRVFAERVSDRDMDTVMIQMGLSNGISVQGLFSLGSVEESRCEVYGNDCKLSIDRYNSWKVNRQGLHAMGLRVKIRDFFGEIGAFPYGMKKIRSPENEPSYWIALNHFINGVRSHGHVKPDIEDGFRVMAIISAAEKSIEDGCLKRVESDV